MSGVSQADPNLYLLPVCRLNTCYYLGGQGDLVNGLIMGINGVTISVIGVINLLTKFS